MLEGTRFVLLVFCAFRETVAVLYEVRLAPTTAHLTAVEIE